MQKACQNENSFKHDEFSETGALRRLLPGPAQRQLPNNCAPCAPNGTCLLRFSLRTFGDCRCSKGISSVFDPKHIDHIGARPAWPVRLLTKRRWEEFLQRALQARVRKLELQPANFGDVEIPNWPVRNYLSVADWMDLWPNLISRATGYLYVCSEYAKSALRRLCSLIPGLGVKLSNHHPCRAHCSLRGRGKPSA
jgi:hypothetical protein